MVKLRKSARAPTRTRTRKNAPNKAKQAFRDALRTYAVGKKVDPHFWLVRLLADTHVTLESVTTDEDGVVHHVHTPTVPLALKFAAACELAQYLEPKLRSVVLSGDAANPVQLLHAMPQADFDTLLARRLHDAGYTGWQGAMPEGTVDDPS